MELSEARLLAAGSVDLGRPFSNLAGARSRSPRSHLGARYARATAATVREQLPWAVVVFLATYACVAVFEVQLHPQRLLTYAVIYALGAVWCGLAIALIRSASPSPRRSLAVTTLLGVGLIANTTLYHIVVRGEAEVLALGNLYLMIGFLAAFPWGGWPQLAVALAACGGLGVGLLTTVHSSVSSGIVLSGMLSLGGLSVASAILTDRYRYRLFQTQEELSAAKEAAEAASHARRDFVASVSHDLRTPVNIIFGMADMALDVAVTTEQREFVETIKREAGQLHALLNDLLDFSKMDAGVVSLAPRRFGLRAWLAASLEAHAAEAAAKRLQLDAAVDPAVPESMVGDPDRLRQVLGNLVGNAIKFTDAGQVSVHVSVTDDVRGERPRLHCAVSDTGVGIAAEESARLFEPFAQAAATSRSHAGTGLGLAICKRLIEQMGGGIGLESRVGRGSTFWFTVPLA
jgi:signal transduction histidine kinase